MHFSNFGNKFRAGTGIGALMRDLADLPDDGRPLYRLGGGNPALIAPIAAVFRQNLQALAADQDTFDRHTSRYPSAQGHLPFIESLADLLNRQYGWQLTRRHIALTNGSQNAFFMLFNMFAGRLGEQQRRILLPLAPEYIGYEDVSIGAPFFTAGKPRIEHLDAHTFKYRLATENQAVDESIAAICVSRPTNPTGNVITDAELNTLDAMALQAGIPLIIDNAYGAPFPDIMHVSARLLWHDNIILSMSLSKLGLPAARTGIVIARPDIIETITEMNAVLNLSPVNMAAAMLQPLLENGELLRLCEQHIRPFYQQRVHNAIDWFKEAFNGLPALVHKPEGSIFLWLWFPELPITTTELYRRLKARGVVVVPGKYFFPGLAEDWPHKQQCIRVNVAGDAVELRTGLGLIAKEVRNAMNQCL
jgi:valine--pyruvate aminotransferase